MLGNTLPACNATLTTQSKTATKIFHNCWRGTERDSLRFLGAPNKLLNSSFRSKRIVDKGEGEKKRWKLQKLTSFHFSPWSVNNCNAAARANIKFFVLYPFRYSYKIYLIFIRETKWYYLAIFCVHILIKQKTLVPSWQGKWFISSNIVTVNNSKVITAVDTTLVLIGPSNLSIIQGEFCNKIAKFKTWFCKFQACT